MNNYIRFYIKISNLLHPKLIISEPYVLYKIFPMSEIFPSVFSTLLVGF